MEVCGRLMDNRIIVSISFIILAAHLGSKAYTCGSVVYGNITMPVTLSFDNNGILKRRIINRNDTRVFSYFPPASVSDGYIGRLSYNITENKVSITIINTTLEDAGNYTLNDYSVFPSEVLHQIQLYILGKPLKPLIVVEHNGTVGNTSGSIKCETESTSKPSGTNLTYTWMNNYEIIETKTNKYTFQGPGGMNLLINVDRNETSNEYMCTATELYGTTSELSSATNVYPDRSPLVRMIPEINVYTEIEQGNMSLECNVTDGKPTFYTYKWFINNTELPTVIGFLSLYNITRYEAGRYNCSADNMVKPAGQSGIRLEVLYGPDIRNKELISQEEGHNLEISCQVDSNPTALERNMTWLRPNNSTFNETGLHFTISTLNKQDNGTFICTYRLTLTPTYGSPVERLASSMVNVNVLYGPSIEPISNQSVVEGTNTTMMCSIKSNPIALYDNVTWKKYGNSSFAQKGPQLNLPSVNRNDHGIYSCSVNITLLPTDSPAVPKSAFENAELDVLYGPSIIQMDPFSQLEGDNVTIKCEIKSNPMATNDDVEWKKDGDIVFRQTGLKLNITPVKREDKGMFFCSVTIKLTPSHGEPVELTDTKPVQVNVLYGPEINPIPNQSIEEGENITVECNVQSNPEATSDNVTWSKHGNHTFAQKGLQLHIPRVDRMDNGNFVCRVELKYVPTVGLPKDRHQTEIFLMNVLYQPNITYLDVITDDIFEGNSTTANCSAYGNPMPTITWFYLENDTTIINNVGSDTSMNYTSSHIKLNSARCEDTGTYLCKANNGIVSPINKTVKIDVKCKPRLSSMINSGRNITVGRNESLAYTVMFHSFPLPTFKWTFNKTELIGFNITTIKDRLLYKSGSRIQKDEITDADIGLYEVIADNQLGIEKTSFYIIFQREPDPPLLLSLSCTHRPRSAKIKWKAGNNGGLDQRFVIQYKKDTEEEFVDAQTEITEDNSQESYSEFIDSLNPGLSYMFRVKALNSKGISFSMEVNCTVVDVNKSESQAVTIIMIVVSLILVLTFFGGAGGVMLFRKRREQKKGKLLERPSTDNIDENDEDGLKDNPMYVSSGPTTTEHKKAAIYSTVEKAKKTGLSKEQKDNNESSVYAEVVKSNKKGKETSLGKQLNKERKKGEKKSDKLIEMGCVYQNSENIHNLKKEDVYANANTPDHVQSRKEYQPSKNKDGLIYADLDLAPGPMGNRFVIRGLENRSNYAIIDLTKKAEPLPSDSDNEDETKSTEDKNSP